MKHPLRSAAGYTLLELIVVMAIFAVFAAMAYGGLTTVLRTRRAIEIELARTAQYQKAYQRMRDDFQNAVPRTVRDVDGTPLPVFRFDNYLHRAEFTRGGWANPADLPRATLERVSYYLDDSRAGERRLVRRSWRVLDRAPQAQPVELDLLDGVDELKWRFLDSDLQWHDDWQQSTALAAPTSATSTVSPNDTVAALPVPAAVEISMQTRDWGSLRFLFRLGAEGYTQAPAMVAAANKAKTPVGNRPAPGPSQPQPSE